MSNITNQNELIANFLGTSDDGVRIRIKHRDCSLMKKYYPNQLKYHNNWSWLMPVVSKIESLGFEVIIVSNHCQIIDRDGDFDFQLYHESYKLKSVYESVMAFIKWYTVNEKALLQQRKKPAPQLKTIG